MLKTIKIEEETHKQLAAYGNKGETFNDIFIRLLNEVKKVKVK